MSAVDMCVRASAILNLSRVLTVAVKITFKAAFGYVQFKP